MKVITLRFNYEFSRVYKRGHFAIGKYITVHSFKRPGGLKHNTSAVPSDINRIGFCANKKQLGAVRRNKAKRLMREAYYQVASDIPLGNDIVFTLKTCEELPGYNDILKDMRKLLKRLHLMESEGAHDSSSDDKDDQVVPEVHITEQDALL
ncbi:MAG: ribonuclease P protein component [Clostridiales bacterium]|nr:ribonuclease P protein component [Clostridiales bacterium]